MFKRPVFDIFSYTICPSVKRASSCIYTISNRSSIGTAAIIITIITTL